MCIHTARRDGRVSLALIGSADSAHTLYSSPCMTFSQDTSLMAAGFAESYIRLWNLKGEKLKGFRSDFNASSVKDGELFLSQSNLYLTYVCQLQLFRKSGRRRVPQHGSSSVIVDPSILLPLTQYLAQPPLQNTFCRVLRMQRSACGQWIPSQTSLRTVDTRIRCGM